MQGKYTLITEQLVRHKSGCQLLWNTLKHNDSELIDSNTATANFDSMAKLKRLNLIRLKKLAAEQTMKNHWIKN
jgi:hypothetical protein